MFPIRSGIRSGSPFMISGVTGQRHRRGDAAALGVMVLAGDRLGPARAGGGGRSAAGGGGAAEAWEAPAPFTTDADVAALEAPPGDGGEEGRGKQEAEHPCYV